MWSRGIHSGTPGSNGAWPLPPWLHGRFVGLQRFQSASCLKTLALFGALFRSALMQAHIPSLIKAKSQRNLELPEGSSFSSSAGVSRTWAHTSMTSCIFCSHENISSDPFPLDRKTYVCLSTLIRNKQKWLQSSLIMSVNKILILFLEISKVEYSGSCEGIVSFSESP